MCFVHDDPMRTPGFRAKLLDSGEYAHEHRGAVGERHSQKIDSQRMFTAIQDLENFRGAGNPVWSAKRYEFLEFVVIAFRVEQANLIVSLHHPYDDRAHRRVVAA